MDLQVLEPESGSIYWLVDLADQSARGRHSEFRHPLVTINFSFHEIVRYCETVRPALVYDSTSKLSLFRPLMLEIKSDSIARSIEPVT